MSCKKIIKVNVGFKVKVKLDSGQDQVQGHLLPDSTEVLENCRGEYVAPWTCYNQGVEPSNTYR